jgi:hypothetical protein
VQAAASKRYHARWQSVGFIPSGSSRLRVLVGQGIKTRSENFNPVASCMKGLFSVQKVLNW